MTLDDGKILTMFGTPAAGGGGTSKTFEVYDPNTNTWAARIPIPAGFDYLYYPWTYLLPGGDLFSAGNADHGVFGPGMSRRYSWSAPVDDPAKRWPTAVAQRSTGGERGTSVLLPLRPPHYEPRILMMCGDPVPAQKTAEMIDLSAASPAWAKIADLSTARPYMVNSVLMPDGRVFVAGGISGSGGPCEIYDPSNPGAGWQLGPAMTHERVYHSTAILLPDGSIVMGGTPSGGPQPEHERYFPDYFNKPRPAITSALPHVQYGHSLTIHTPQAPSIAEVVLLRPGSVTHGFNTSQRFVGCAITHHSASSIDVQMPADGTIAPPGYYLLFIVDGGRVPSEAVWIRITA